MLSAAELQLLRTGLIQRAGGWLRNPIRRERLTCLVCATPSRGYLRCYTCEGHAASAGSRLADRVAPLTYALAGHQSGYVMRGYKAPDSLREHREYVAMLGLIGLRVHLDCPGGLAGTAVTQWAIVPSLPARQGDHPLRTLLAPMVALPEAPMTAARSVSNPRSVNRRHYTAAAPIPDGGHVLLLDDTWTSGGHAQSAALALRAGGAAQVSVLAIARWIDARYEENGRFIRDELRLDYDPSRCPWTGSDCPDPAR